MNLLPATSPGLPLAPRWSGLVSNHAQGLLPQLYAGIDARTAKRAGTRFFEHIRTITAYLVFPDWTTLMQTLIDSKPPPNIEAQVTK